jgi:hypothetical protein
VAESVYICGTVEECIEQVEDLARVGATQLITFAGSEKTIANFSEVIRYFREQNQ